MYRYRKYVSINIEINMMTDAGVPVPFNSGKSFVVLEFRRATYKYFMTKRRVSFAI